MLRQFLILFFVATITQVAFAEELRAGKIAVQKNTTSSEDSGAWERIH